MLESALQTKVLKYLNSLKDCEAENVKGVAGQAGRPDINACYKGRLIRLELKIPDHRNVPTKLQLANLRRWSEAGAICLVAYSFEEVKFVISERGIACDKHDCLECPVRKKYCFTQTPGGERICSLISPQD